MIDAIIPDALSLGVRYTDIRGAVFRGLWDRKDVDVKKPKVARPAALDRPVASADSANRVADRGELVRRVHEILDGLATRDDTLTHEEIRAEIEAVRKQAAVE